MLSDFKNSFYIVETTETEVNQNSETNGIHTEDEAKAGNVSSTEKAAVETESNNKEESLKKTEEQAQKKVMIEKQILKK